VAAAVVAHDKIRKNPTDTITLRAFDKVEDEDDQHGYAMTPAEADTFLAAVGELHRLYALYFVALATGMRWHNVQLIEKDSKPPHIRVREEIRPVERKPMRLPPKSKHSRRDIWLDPLTVTTLQAHRVHQHCRCERDPGPHLDRGHRRYRGV
jgi:hypothetical protein